MQAAATRCNVTTTVAVVVVVLVNAQLSSEPSPTGPRRSSMLGNKSFDPLLVRVDESAHGPPPTRKFPPDCSTFSVCGTTQNLRGDHPSFQLVQTRMGSLHVAKNEAEALR